MNRAGPPGAGAWFARRYGREPDGIWFAPGRVNLIGGPDYNEVFVLPFALGAGVCAAASRRPDRRIALMSRRAGCEPVLLSIDGLQPGSVPGWAAGAAGARMTGGGFGGCVVALVPADRARQVRTAVTERFTRHRWPAPHYLDAVPSDGARRIR